MEVARIHLPRLGLRNIKTVISATLCAVLYSLIDRNPTFACIGAVFGMDNSMENSLRTGGNRLIGTVIGGFMGMFFFYIYNEYRYSSASTNLPIWIFLLVGIMLMIYLCQIFHAVGAVHAGSVVFFIVMLNTPEHEYISYALNRMVDTGFGVIMSIGINALLPRELLEKHMSKRALEKEIGQLKENREAYEQNMDHLLRKLESIEREKYPVSGEGREEDAEAETNAGKTVETAPAETKSDDGGAEEAVNYRSAGKSLR